MIEHTETDGTDDIGPHVLVPTDQPMKLAGYRPDWCELWVSRTYDKLRAELKEQSKR